MPEAPSRGQGLDPQAAWTVLTDAPLRGLALAREAGRILAWDESDSLYLFDLRGDRVAVSRAPGKIVTAVVADAGPLYVVLGEGGVLWFLGDSLEPIAERPTGIDPAAVAVDAHGRYVALAAKTGNHALFTRYGKAAGQFETRQPIGQMVFVPESPTLVATSAYGAITAIELSSKRGGTKLEAEPIWQQSMMANVGRIATSGDGRTILASCFTHGVHRFDIDGHVAGAYHLDGSATHAVPDFVGRSIAVATIEGGLYVLNSAGHVRWQTGLQRPAVALQIDALGRYLIYGQASGEITRLDIEPTGRSDGTPARRPAARAASSPLRKPAWSVPVAQTDEQADFAVLAVLDEPGRIGYMTTGNRLQLFTMEGKPLGQAPEIGGVGRSLRTIPNWISASTDRNILLYDAARNGLIRVDVSLVGLTHLAFSPQSFGLALVQERDRIGRATSEGRWIWKKELNCGIEDIALDPDDRLAATLEDGRLLIFDPEGHTEETTLVQPEEPCLLIEAPENSPDGLSWIAVARRSQWARGLDAEGRRLWEYRLPFEPWRLLRVGPFAVITAPDGRAEALDGSGRSKGQGRDIDSQSLFTIGPKGELLRVSRQGTNLSCTLLDGKALWRAVLDAPVGPIAASRRGIAAMVGRDLVWFPIRP